ncbi:hypothetical protein [Streptomyces sp. NPDC059063]|uniref:hypothetical protein n=1 Tax=unclassified Streptomyces TaxID=2593676 RepID=UPI0036BE8EE9
MSGGRDRAVRSLRGRAGTLLAALPLAAAAPALDPAVPLPQLAPPVRSVVLRTVLVAAQDPAVLRAHEDTPSAAERVRLPGERQERGPCVAERAGPPGPVRRHGRPGPCREPRTSGAARYVECVGVPPAGERVMSVVRQDPTRT